jgi:hypothetical protein
MRAHLHTLNGLSFPADKERIRRYINGMLVFLLMIIVTLVLVYLTPKVWHWFQVLYNTLCDDIYHLYRYPF